MPLLAADPEVAQNFLTKHLLLELSELLPIPSESTQLFLPGAPGAAGEAPGFRFLTAQDILHSLRILRC